MLCYLRANREFVIGAYDVGRGIYAKTMDRNAVDMATIRGESIDGTSGRDGRSRRDGRDGCMDGLGRRGGTDGTDVRLGWRTDRCQSFYSNCFGNSIL